MNVNAVPDSQRFHSLDALRALALLAGIALHAAMSFINGFRELGWPIADASRSHVLEVFFFVVHMFRMALFYLVAGFFARLLLERGGLRDFIRNRLRRIALPLVIFYPLVLPLTILPLVWAARQGGGTPGPGAGQGLQGGFPWGHFWFLYLLLVLYAVLLLLRGAVIAVDGGGRLRSLVDRIADFAFRTRLAPAALAAPLAALLYATPWWPQGGGIPAPITGFIPNTPALAAFGSALLVGWWLHRRQDLLRYLRRDWAAYLGVAVAGSATALLLVGVESHFTVVSMTPAQRAVYAAAYLLAAWCWVFGLTGLALEKLTTPGTRRRYLADASYWMYLVHVPIVWALQAWMMRWPLHWSIKLTAILAISMAVLLASYHYLVRDTFIGKLLNGRRYPRVARVTAAPNTSPG